MSMLRKLRRSVLLRGSAAAGAGARWLMRVRRGAAPTASVADDADGVEELRH